MSEPKATRLSTEDLPDFVEHKLQDIEQQLNLNDKQLTSIMEKMLQEMKKGLAKATNPQAKVKMIPSYVEELPDGSENGSYLALDLGGTNFRVLLVTITSGKSGSKSTIEMDSQIFKMSHEVITGTGNKLFDHIADCMSQFMAGHKLQKSKLPVGFTFSFPCKQEGLDHATLITWTKGFTAPGVVGHDVVKMLKEAVARHKGLDVDIIAVVNDTVGTMMSCAFDNPSCNVGLIVGTGSNACYMEKKSNIELISSNDGEMCINMEWGAFGDDGALDEFRTTYDKEVDKHSLNPGKQIYEKMISGMYIGEIVRLMLCNLIEQKVLFAENKKAREILKKRNSFDTVYASKVESKLPFGMTAVQNLLAKLDIGARKIECEVIARACQSVSKRAAHICAAGVAAIARKIKENHPEKSKMKIAIGVDGSVYKKHPTFKTLMAEKVRKLCEGSGIDLEFELSYDGSGKGAALITAVAKRQQLTATKK